MAVVTPMFLHAGLMHFYSICFRCSSLVPSFERVAGKARFLTIFLLAGIFANIASFFLGDTFMHHVGASGAIFGIFGAFGALVYLHEKRISPATTNHGANHCH